MATRNQIRALRNEAIQAGDDAMTRTCETALDEGPDSPAWRECEDVIDDASAQSGPDTVRSATLDMDPVATIMLGLPCETYETCEPVTMRAPYTTGILSAEMGGV